MFHVFQCPICEQHADPPSRDCYFVAFDENGGLLFDRKRSNLPVSSERKGYVVHDECISAFRPKLADGSLIIEQAP